MKKTFLIMASFICFLLTLAGQVQAKYDYKFDTRLVKHGHWETEMANKLGRGFTNVAYGWTEILKTPIDMSYGPHQSNIKAVLLGVPYGVTRFVGRLFVGAFEMATFYAPQGPIMAPIQGDVY